LGDNAGFNLTTGSNNIEIGNKGVAGEANTIRIGKQGTQTATYIAGISGATVAGGVGSLSIPVATLAP
jgi:trimeric autotransporter adhesin